MSLPEVAPCTLPEVIATYDHQDSRRDEIQPQDSDHHATERFEDWCPKYSVDEPVLDAAPAVYPDHHQANRASSAPTGYDSSVGWKNGHSEHQAQSWDAWTSGGGGGYNASEKRRPEGSLFCGFPRKVCLLVMVLAALVIAASIGGGVGGGIAVAKGRYSHTPASGAGVASASTVASVPNLLPTAANASSSPTRTVTVGTAVIPNTPTPQFLNNNTYPIPGDGFAFQGFSKSDYQGNASSVIMAQGFTNLSFNCGSYVWVGNTTGCCVTLCTDGSAALGRQCDDQVQTNSSAISRVWIGCGPTADTDHTCSG